MHYGLTMIVSNCMYFKLAIEIIFNLKKVSKGKGGEIYYQDELNDIELNELKLVRVFLHSDIRSINSSTVESLKKINKSTLVVVIPPRYISLDVNSINLSKKIFVVSPKSPINKLKEITCNQKTKRKTDHPFFKKITCRQMQVMELYLSGYSEKEICSALKIKYKTLSLHKKSALKNIGVSRIYDVSFLNDLCYFLGWCDFDLMVFRDI